MSEFDKEAEREKLREQLEAEQEDREATQRMSELLLGGATMTGKHCNNCASPIFRRNGQEFCPNCNQAVGETNQQQASEAGEEIAQDASQADQTVETTGTSQPQVEPTDSIPEGQSGPRREGQPEATTQRQPESARESVPAAGTGEVAVGASADGDLADARAALTRKLSRLAAQSEATDDVGRARELLAATREAAEALAALEQIGDGS